MKGLQHFLLACVIASSAFACASGGSVSSGGGIGGTGIVVGVVDGFGSVFVEGVEFDTSAATITINGLVATEADLQLGMVVTVTGSVDEDGVTGVADTVEFESLVEGPIEELDEDTGVASILGNTVRFDADTVFDGVDPSSGAIDVDVQVSGFVDAEGDVRATRIARRAPSATLVFGGIVRELDAAAQTFRIRRVLVDYSAAEFSGLPLGRLRNGLAARVTIADAPRGGVVDAMEVRLRRIDVDATVDVRVFLRGFVTSLVDSDTFVVDDTVSVRVLDSTRFAGGRRSDIAPGTALGVVGRVLRGRIIAAERITFADEPAP